MANRNGRFLARSVGPRISARQRFARLARSKEPLRPPLAIRLVSTRQSHHLWAARSARHRRQLHRGEVQPFWAAVSGSTTSIRAGWWDTACSLDSVMDSARLCLPRLRAITIGPEPPLRDHSPDRANADCDVARSSEFVGVRCRNKQLQCAGSCFSADQLPKCGIR